MGPTSDNDTMLSDEQNYKSQLEELECPFNWKMNDIINLSLHTKFADEKYDETENFLPLLRLSYAIMNVYVNVKEGIYDTLENDLQKCHICFNALIKSKDSQISTKIAEAVLQATDCFVYDALDKREKLNELLNNLIRINNMNDKEKSTLLGLKSICWSRYDKTGFSEAESCIRKALKLNEKCALWHYILGKILLSKRRSASIEAQRYDEEAISFLRAYEINMECQTNEMSNMNAIYGMSVALMYRKREQYFKSCQMYDNLYDNYFDSLTTTTLLRSALVFTKRGQLNKAKVCLEKAKDRTVSRSMFYHYSAKYHLKTNDFTEATRCFEEAIKDGNLNAEMDYFHYLSENEAASIDLTEYLMNMLNKFRSLDFAEADLQSVILHVAFSYWNREKNLKESIKYFLMAIEIDRQAKCLTRYYSSDVFSEIKNRDVYLYLKNVIFPKFDERRREFDEDTIKKVQDIKEFCEQRNASPRNM